jgi:phenylacetate-CoA ligase
MPLVRFRSRDQVEVLATEAVNRRVSPRVRVLGRTDDMLICRGVNVYPGAVSDIVAGLKPLTTGQFKIVVDFPGHSTDKPIRLRVEASDDTAEPAQIVDLVSQKVKDSLGFKVNVEIVPAGTYENPGSRKPVYIERV